MTITIDVQNITRAKSETFEAGRKFDVVSVGDAVGFGVKLYLPHGTGPAIADLIAAAVSENLLTKGGE